MAGKTIKLKKLNEQKPSFVPFEKENVLKPLKLFFIIVPFGQANSIIARLNEFDIACSFVLNGEGTVDSQEMQNLLGLRDTKKQIIITLVREDKTEFVIRKLEERFAISKAAKGVAFSIKVTSVAGVSIYKFLTNTRKVTKVEKNGNGRKN